MKKQYYILFLMVILSSAARAQCLLDQDQPIYNGGRSARNLPGFFEAQSFTAGSGGLLCQLDMLMFVSMNGTGTLNIFKGEGISGPLLASQSVTVNVPGNVSVWQTWSLFSPPVVTEDSVYTFQFVPIQGGGIPDPYGVNVDLNDVYAGGVDISNPTGDLAFRTYISNCSSFSLTTATACTSFLWNGNLLTSSGTYSDTLLNATGCDSIMTLNLTINPSPVVSFNLGTDTLCLTGPALLLTGGLPSGGSYSGTGVALGAFSPSIAGNGTHSLFYSYSDQNGCQGIDSVQVFVDACTGLMDHASLLNMLVIPNPSNTQAVLKFATPLNNAVILLRNSLGQTMRSIEFVSGKTYTIDRTNMPAGMYFIQVFENAGFVAGTSLIFQD